MEPSAELKGRLFHLRQRFVENMPARISAVGGTLAECRFGGREAADRLERQFHTLAGTAGTYGLNAVCAAAREAEEVCATHSSSVLDVETREYLGFLVDQLRGALAVDAPDVWTAQTILTATEATYPAFEVKSSVSSA